MKKLFCALMLIGMTTAVQPVIAQSAAPAPGKQKATKKPVKKAAVKKTSAKDVAAPAAAASADGDDEDLGEANVEGSLVTNLSCELGNKLTTYVNEGDDNYIAIRWKDRLHRLRKVGTSTGAGRYENKKYGLVWISIPSKAMLLDSKKGQQLANECRNTEQAKAHAAKG